MEAVINDLVSMSQRKEGIRSHLEGKSLAAIELEIEILDRSAMTLSEMEQAHQQQLQAMHKALKQMQHTISKLELVALIHGIDDLEYWMNKERGYLVNELLAMREKSITQVPIRLRPTFYLKYQ